MKKIMLCLAVLFSVVFLLNAGAYAEVNAAPAELRLAESSVQIQKGKTAVLKAESDLPEAVKKLEWESSDPKIATVKNGTVKGVACGECDIVCRVKDEPDMQAVCHVSVIQMISNIAVKNKNLTVGMFSSVKPEVDLKPKDATNPVLSWSSSDPSVAAVNEEGEITALGGGDCVVTAAATDGSGKSLDLKIHVPAYYTAESSVTVIEGSSKQIELFTNGINPADLKAAGGKKAQAFIGEDTVYISGVSAGKDTVKITHGKDALPIEITVIKPVDIVYSGEYGYIINEDGTAMMVAYTGPSTVDELKIPGEIDGLTVSALGYQAFQQLTAGQIIIPDSVTDIDTYCFYSCTADKIQLPASLNLIRENAFMGCTFETVEIPAAVRSIPANPFNFCRKLLSITVDPDNPYYRIYGGALVDIRDNELICYPIGLQAETYTVPSEVEIIGEEAFVYAKIKALVIPDNVKDIRFQAFLFSSVESVEAYGLERMGSAFHSCDLLKTVRLPETLKSIYGSAFQNDKSLETINLPASLTEIDRFAFTNAEGATFTVTEGSYAKKFVEKNGYNFVLAD